MKPHHLRAHVDRARGERPTSQPDYERTQPPGIRYDHEGNVLTQRSEGILPSHAAARAVVSLPDGRTGRLIRVAPYGRSAKVQLPSGKYLTMPLDRLTLSPDRETPG